MTLAVTQAVEAIKLQLEPLRREVDELEGRLSEIHCSKRKLEAALKALTGKTANSGDKRRKATKPCAKKDTVLDVCLAIVRDNEPIPIADLELLAKDKIGKDLGYSLSGVQLRLKECLSSASFSVSEDDKVSLTTINSGNENDV